MVVSNIHGRPEHVLIEVATAERSTKRSNEHQSVRLGLHVVLQVVLSLFEHMRRTTTVRLLASDLSGSAPVR